MPILFNEKNLSGEFPIITAVYKEDVELVKLLLQKQANVMVKTRQYFNYNHGSQGFHYLKDCHYPGGVGPV